MSDEFDGTDTDIPDPTSDDDQAAAAAATADEAADPEDPTTEVPEEPEPQSDDDHDQGKGNEAAKYRRRLRDTEAERDTLKGRLEQMQRSEVERLAGEDLADGRDFWRDGAELASVLDDDGNVDPAKVTAAARNLVQAHTHWGARSSTTIGSRSGSGASAATGKRRDPWTQAFTPNSK